MLINLGSAQLISGTSRLECLFILSHLQPKLLLFMLTCGWCYSGRKYLWFFETVSKVVVF
jgi:hypothetical protein